MAKPKLPAAVKATIAEHEAGKHDVYNGGYPTKGPQPETCRDCVKRAAEEVIADEWPTPTVPRKDRVRVVKASPESPLQPEPPTTGALDLPVPAEVPAGGMAEKAAGIIPDVYTPPGMGFSTDLSTAEEPRTREEWMLNAVSVMRGWFPEEHPVPEVRVSIGWPAGRGSSRFIGQCFYAVADHVPALFVAPSLAEVPEILETLLHECIHAATPVGTGHKGLFVKLAKGLGFTGPWRSTPATPELKATLADLAVNLGPFPHSKVLKSDATRPSVQGTRMLKVECQTCGCIIRMTNKWIEEAGLPTCGCGEEMRQAA